MRPCHHHLDTAEEFKAVSKGVLRTRFQTANVRQLVADCGTKITFFKNDGDLLAIHLQEKQLKRR